MGDAGIPGSKRGKFPAAQLLGDFGVVWGDAAVLDCKFDGSCGAVEGNGDQFNRNAGIVVGSHGNTFLE